MRFYTPIPPLTLILDAFAARGRERLYRELGDEHRAQLEGRDAARIEAEIEAYYEAQFERISLGDDEPRQRRFRDGTVATARSKRARARAERRMNRVVIAEAIYEA